MKLMHKIQEQLLALADTENLGVSSFYSLAKRLGVSNHGSIKFHLDQLVNKGLLYRSSDSKNIVRVQEDDKFSGFLSIPVMGEANCGAATRLADDQIKEFLRLSPSLLPKSNLNRLYALKAAGNSMNRAHISGKPINDGDYVIIEKIDQANDGDYVVSIFDDVANIKKLIFDKPNSRIALVSESFEQHSPIIISEEDMDSYSIAGRVVTVIPPLPKL